MPAACYTTIYTTVRAEGRALDGLHVVFAVYPPGLEIFSPSKRAEPAHATDRMGVVTRERWVVRIVCPGRDGVYDLTPLLVAADWCRDRGYAVHCEDGHHQRPGLPHDPD